LVEAIMYEFLYDIFLDVGFVVSSLHPTSIYVRSLSLTSRLPSVIEILNMS
jgi:hypothetical protein